MEQKKSANEIFDELLDSQSSDFQKELVSKCGDDEELRHEVIDLIDSYNTSPTINLDDDSSDDE